MEKKKKEKKKAKTQNYYKIIKSKEAKFSNSNKLVFYIRIRHLETASIGGYSQSTCAKRCHLPHFDILPEGRKSRGFD